MYYLRKHDYERASTLFGGDSSDDYFGRAIIHAELGESEKAIELLSKVIELVPNHAGAYYNLGFIYTKLGKFKEGLEYTRRGIELEPAYEDKRLRLCLGSEVTGFGPYYTMRGEGEAVPEEQTLEITEAHEETETVLPELDLPSSTQYIEQAEEHMKHEDYESALSALDQAIAIDSESEKAILLKSQVLARTANVSDAINLLKKHGARHPENQTVASEVAQLMEHAERFDEAKQMYLSLLKVDSANVDWLARVAELSYRLEQFDEALAYYSKLYDLDKENLAANLGFLRICIKNKNLSKAVSYITFLGEKHPDNYEFNFLAGLYHMERGEREDAAAHFKKAIDIDSSKPDPYYQYGLLQIQNGDFEGACSNWKKALLLSPDDELLKKIRHCLRITVELSEFIKNEASP
jgi:tetratricopeptide (TPR) repeat protein